jgi:hypothetical protein
MNCCLRSWYGFFSVEAKCAQEASKSAAACNIVIYVGPGRVKGKLSQAAPLRSCLISSVLKDGGLWLSGKGQIWVVKLVVSYTQISIFTKHCLVALLIKKIVFCFIIYILKCMCQVTGSDGSSTTILWEEIAQQVSGIEIKTSMCMQSKNLSWDKKNTWPCTFVVSSRKVQGKD